jgi:hypothetical protein
MTGVSCLIKNTDLQRDLQDIVEYLAYSRIAAGREASVGTVYNAIRKSGIEVDLQTIGHIYNEVLDKSYEQMMSDQEVNDFVLKSFNDSIKRAALLEPEAREEQIGENSPEIYVANGIMNMFYSSEMPDQNTQSDMLKMQNALWKGIQRKLKVPAKEKPATPEQWRDVLNRSLGYEELGITDLNGRLNSIADLYDAMRDEVSNAMSEAEQLADPATFERLQEMVNGLEASTYGLLLSKGEAKKLLYDMMKDAGFGKELKNGKVIINWNKLAGDIGSVQDLRANVEKVLSDNGYGADVIEGVKDSLENEFIDLQTRILEQGHKELSRREAAIDRQSSAKSDLRRLAELNTLGIFDRAHDRVLFNLLGVGELQQQDMEDLKKIATAASNLYRDIDKNYGSEVFASRQFQSLQRAIDSIIARNINNKTALLKAISLVKNFFDVYLTGLLMGPFTILENLWSGIKEILVPSVSGAGFSKQNVQIYWNMLGDVTSRGQAFGEEVGSFAPRELYVNTLQFKWSKDPKTIAENILFALTLPARIGLLGFDSANKVTITNKTFKNAIYSALVQKGMSKEDAKKTMNEALYGQSFEKAKEEAKKIIEKTNTDLPGKYKIPVNGRSITTLANDLVKANLNANGALSPEVIEAAYKSSYHVAGYGLGHEPNNALSAQIKLWRNSFAKRDQELAEAKDWSALAVHRLKGAFMNSMVLRFTGGATNWMYLRAQSGWGIGLLTGFGGKWNKDIDFSSKDKIQESVKDIQNARNKISRAVVGLSVTAIAYFIGYFLSSGEDDEEKQRKIDALSRQKEELKKTSYTEFENGAEEKAMKVAELELAIRNLQVEMSVMKRIKSDWMTSRLFRKTAPDAMLLKYYLNTEKNEILAVSKYIQNTYGIGNQFSTASKMQEAGELGYKGETEAAKGQLSSIVGDRFGVPIWRAGKDWTFLARWIGGESLSSDYKAPQNFSDGLWGGGMLEDLGLYDRNPSITILPGVGSKAYELFQQKGIKDMNDLKKIPEWWNMTYENDNGNEVPILNATNRIKAREAAQEWEKQK